MVQGADRAPERSSSDPDGERPLDLPLDALSVHERRRRRRYPGSDPRLEVTPHARGDLVRAPLALEPIQVELEASRPVPEMRVVDVALVEVDRVAHLPEP